MTKSGKKIRFGKKIRYYDQINSENSDYYCNYILSKECF